ncbi:conserved hypothetical protein [Coccidioides posadasii str. Silveira]|uniref:Uncharacterized protein n=1 Tax=Coccidioides posadasii (strain RMSCC 757 / Silveira) TaxID=443226 RepID=E9D982_COCPS|nr:conserved hypothetical protein [Coccidioides posadasii str. Silveira]
MQGSESGNMAIYHCGLKIKLSAVIRREMVTGGCVVTWNTNFLVVGEGDVARRRAGGRKINPDCPCLVCYSNGDCSGEE